MAMNSVNEDHVLMSEAGVEPKNKWTTLLSAAPTRQSRTIGFIVQTVQPPQRQRSHGVACVWPKNSLINYIRPRLSRYRPSTLSTESATCDNLSWSRAVCQSLSLSLPPSPPVRLSIRDGHSRAQHISRNPFKCFCYFYCPHMRQCCRDRSRSPLPLSWTEIAMKRDDSFGLTTYRDNASAMASLRTLRPPLLLTFPLLLKLTVLCH